MSDAQKMLTTGNSAALRGVTTPGRIENRWIIKDETVFWQNLDENCLPRHIITMTAADYPDFLKERRVLMAQKIRDYYEKL